MLVLSGTDFPTGAPGLSAAAKGGLAMFFQLPAGREVVEFAGEYPHFSRAAIDLTNFATDANHLPPDPKGAGQLIPAFDAERLDVFARPMRLRGSPLALSLTCENAAFDYDRDAAGRPVLLLRDARNGQVTASMGKPDLQSLILSFAKEFAAEHGLSVTEAHLEWTQLDQRSIGVAVSITVRKLLTAKITVVGRLKIDDEMVARLTDMQCSGAGMISTLACAAIRPKLQKVEGRALSLATLAAGEVHLRDVQITVGDALVVQAKFGG